MDGGANIGIDKWDSIPNYHNWLLKMFKECERILKNSGTLWFFHMHFRDLSKIDELLKKETSFKHKQLIIIDKGIQSIAGRSGDMLRSFPKATEYLQFYTFEDLTGAEQLSEVYAKTNPFAKYLKEEFKRAKISNKEIANLFPSKTGGFTGCVSNWLLGYNVPLKEQYLKMRKYLNDEYLRKEYEDLRKEYEDLRYTFNVPTRTTDVWKINFYKEKKYGHCTQKPQTILRKVIRACSKENDIVLDPFMGSGSTGIACIDLNRKFIGIEINKQYFDIATKRIADWQHQTRL